MRIVFLLIISIGFLKAFSSDKDYSIELNVLYHKGQRAFARKDYNKALPLLEKYLLESVEKKYRRERLFWVIDQVGRIHLRINRNPDEAIKFFEKTLKDKRLSEAEEDDLLSWLSAAKDWKKHNKKVERISSDEELYLTGKKYYDKGDQIKEFPADNKGNAYFVISKTYLIHLIRNFQSSKRMPEALLILGKIQLNLRTDPEYWGDNHYLKEVIRQYPNTKISQEAFKVLSEDIEIGFSGSSGNNTPDSIKKMLQSYKKLAMPAPRSQKD